MLLLAKGKGSVLGDPSCKTPCSVGETVRPFNAKEPITTVYPTHPNLVCKHTHHQTESSHHRLLILTSSSLLLLDAYLFSGFGVIHSPHIEDAFRCTDRRFFVPPDHRDSAYQDNPLRQGQLHISAPHIYGTVLEALELKPNSSFSFLNAGSGTGYLSSMVAHILGPTSLSINIDCHQEALEHGQQAVAAWKATREAPLAEMQFLLGNVLQIETNKGECLRGFDRIYVGATLEKSSLPALANLLKVGGILVGPGMHTNNDLIVVVFSIEDTRIAAHSRTVFLSHSTS